jgi:hypothetical protein
MWVLGLGVASTHAVATPDGTDRAIMQRVAARAVKATLRVPAATLAPGSLRIGAAHLVPAHADTRAGAPRGRSRLYALFHVFQL